MELFALACFLLIVTPGPGVLSCAGVGSGFGFAHGARYISGLCLGNAVVGLVVVSGGAAIVLAEPVLRTAMLIVSVLYLCYLAAKIAFAGSKIAFTAARTAPSARDGFALQFVNPKAYVVNTALFTGFAFYPESYIAEITIKFLILNAIWLPIHFLWLGAGVTIRRMDLDPKVQRAINVGMAIAMLAVVGLALWEQQI